MRFRGFLPIAVGITIVLAVVYVNEQQVLRLGANEPQDGLADQAAAQVAAGQLPAEVASSASVAIESSAAPYIVFYDANGDPIAGTGLLEGVLPHIPLGIFDVARARHGKDRVTWQPQSGIRQAIVVEPVQDSFGTGAVFVMAGRSLAYTEQQESQLGWRMLIGWIASLAAVFAVSVLASLRKRSR